MNIHPRLKELFEAQANNHTLLEAFSPSPQVTVVVFQMDGYTKRSRVMKADIGLRFAKVQPSVRAKEGESINEVIQRFSDKYGLYLLPGIDYDLVRQPVRFSESLDKNKVVVSLVISDVALGWYGKVSIDVLNEERVRTVAGVATSVIENMRLAVALSSKVFTGEENVLTPGRDALTLNFVRRVYDYLKECGIKSLKPQSLGQAQLIDLISDGISKIAVIKPVDGPGLFIRYDTNPPKQPSVVSE